MVGKRFAIGGERDGRCLRPVCVLLAAALVLLTAQGALVSVYLIPRSDLFRVRVIDGGQWVTISNEEDGLFVTWDSRHDCPFCSFQVIWRYEPGQDPTPHSVWARPGRVYRVDDNGWMWRHRVLWLPRLTVAGLLMLWPVIHWVRARRRKQLASVPGFDVA